MFSPLAYTLGFALLGALLFTLTLVLALSSILLKKNVVLMVQNLMLKVNVYQQNVLMVQNHLMENAFVVMAPHLIMVNVHLHVLGVSSWKTEYANKI